MSRVDARTMVFPPHSQDVDRVIERYKHDNERRTRAAFGKLGASSEKDAVEMIKSDWLRPLDGRRREADLDRVYVSPDDVRAAPDTPSIHRRRVELVKAADDDVFLPEMISRLGHTARHSPDLTKGRVAKSVTD